MDIKFLLPLLAVIIPFSLSFFYSYGYLLLSSSHFSFQFSSSFHIYVDGYVSFFSLWPLLFILCSFPGLFYVYAIYAIYAIFIFSQMLHFSAIPFSQGISNFSIFRFYRSLPSLKAISYYYSSEPRNRATENTENLLNSFLFFNILQQ